MSELLMQARNKHFWDQELLDQCFRGVPISRRPQVMVYCGSSQEYLLIQEVMPQTERVTFVYPENLAIDLFRKNSAKEIKLTIVHLIMFFFGLLFMASFVFLSNTLLGFAFSVSSGIIIGEAFLVLRHLRRKSKCTQP